MKRLLQLVTALALVSCILAGAAALAEGAPTGLWTDSGNYDTSWFTAGNDYYEVSTPAQLAGLAVLVNGGETFSNSAVALKADIDLGAHLWVPIGTPEHSFDGLFSGWRELDGDDSWRHFYTIDGIVIRGGTGANGLFGCLGKDATIQLIGVSAEIESTGESCVGGIAGMSHDAMFTDCYMLGGRLVGKDVGGIVGRASGNLTLEYCYVENTYMESPLDIGGIAGRIDKTEDVFIKNSSIDMATCQLNANGTPSDNPIYVGDPRDNITLINACYVNANRSDFLNGVPGRVKVCEVSRMDTDWWAASLQSALDNARVNRAENPDTVLSIIDLPANVNNGLYIAEEGTIEIYPYRRIELQLGEISIVALEDGDAFHVGEDAYLHLSGDASVFTDAGYACVNNEGELVVDGSVQLWEEDGDFGRIITNNADTAVDTDGCNANVYLAPDVDWYGDGSGSFYEVYNPWELAGLAELVNSGVDDFEDKTITLENDIDLFNEYNDWYTIYEWIPIGTEEHPFRGKIEGRGHDINELQIRSNDYKDMGFFGVVDSARYNDAERLFIDDVNFNGVNLDGEAEYTGIVAGRASGAMKAYCDNGELPYIGQITGTLTMFDMERYYPNYIGDIAAGCDWYHVIEIPDSASLADCFGDGTGLMIENNEMLLIEGDVVLDAGRALYFMALNEDKWDGMGRIEVVNGASLSGTDASSIISVPSGCDMSKTVVGVPGITEPNASYFWDNGKWTAMDASYEVDDKLYDTLDAALAAASPNESVISLTRDAYENNTVVLASGNGCSLNLNGYDLTLRMGLEIENGAWFSIEWMSGVIDGTIYANGALNVWNGSLSCVELGNGEDCRLCVGGSAYIESLIMTPESSVFTGGYFDDYFLVDNIAVVPYPDTDIEIINSFSETDFIPLNRFFLTEMMSDAGYRLTYVDDKHNAIKITKDSTRIRTLIEFADEPEDDSEGRPGCQYQYGYATPAGVEFDTTGIKVLSLNGDVASMGYFELTYHDQDDAVLDSAPTDEGWYWVTVGFVPYDAYKGELEPCSAIADLEVRPAEETPKYAKARTDGVAYCDPDPDSDPAFDVYGGMIFRIHEYAVENGETWALVQVYGEDMYGWVKNSSLTYIGKPQPLPTVGPIVTPVPTATPAPTPTPTPAPGSFAINNFVNNDSPLNIRTRPSTDGSDIIGKVPVGEYITVVEYGVDWTYGTYDNATDYVDDDVTGYMATRFLKFDTWDALNSFIINNMDALLAVNPYYFDRQNSELEPVPEFETQPESESEPEQPTAPEPEPEPDIEIEPDIIDETLDFDAEIVE